MKRFDLSRSPVDNMYRRFELRSASSLGILDLEALDAKAIRDYDVWVCTGVFKRRKDVFNNSRREKK